MTRAGGVTFAWLAFLVSLPARAVEVHDRAAAARDAIEVSEVRRRDEMAHLFTLDQSIRSTARRTLTLSRRAVEYELEAARLGRSVRDLNRRTDDRARQMNYRLGSLYRRRVHAQPLRTMFTAESPAELDRHQRFVRALIEDDHQHLRMYVAGLREAQAERKKLGAAVRRLVLAQREVRATELKLSEQRSERERVVTQLKLQRDSRLNELRALREVGARDDLAFFERRGTLRAPVSRPVTRAFGMVDDPDFKVRLNHKGWFFGGAAGAKFSAVADGRVEVARRLPGWGQTVVVDHGNHYRTVYACAGELRVREGDAVVKDQTLGSTGDRSPLFGPGLYFEIRHFADAVDPRPWIEIASSPVRPARLGVIQ